MEDVGTGLPIRRSIRLKGYDYSQGGMYYVTICTESRRCVLGDVVDGGVITTDIGAMAARWWNKIPGQFESVRLDASVAMPNHLHGVIIIDKPLMFKPGAQDGRTHGSAPTSPSTSAPTLPDMVRWFKTMTTNEFLKGVRSGKWKGLPGGLWQRGYYEHIIRGEIGLHAVREYIRQNPANWETDEENLARPK
jgi:putative transposase